MLYTRYCDAEETEKTKLYMTLLSVKGGKVKIKHTFKTEEEVPQVQVKTAA